MSKKIDWSTEAIAMIDAYKNSNLEIPGSTDEKIRGLMVDADHVREILDNPNHSIQKLFMVFGMKTDENDKQVFNMILVGVDDKDKIVMDPAYDYCLPCPEECSDLPS